MEQADLPSGIQLGCGCWGDLICGMTTRTGYRLVVSLCADASEAKSLAGRQRGLSTNLQLLAESLVDSVNKKLHSFFCGKTPAANAMIRQRYQKRI